MMNIMIDHHYTLLRNFLNHNNFLCFFSFTDVTVEFRDGLPVVSLPLPSRRESCEFTLKPISQNVGDFSRFIKEEDGGVDTVIFYTKG